MKIFQKLRIISLLVLVASLAFIVRVGDFVYGFNQMGSANAAEEATEDAHAEPPAISPKAAAVEHAAEEKAAEKPAGASESTLDLGAAPVDAASSAKGPEKGEIVQWKDSIDSDIDASSVKAEVFEDMSKRREQLDKKEKEIGVREALLSAAERELDQKLRELTNLKTEIEGMMTKMSAEEEARITSLVKIYEGMKPKDAASIFNTLDLDVLMVILTRMSERKSSPIIAVMNEDRARTVTIMMAQQKQAPTLPESN